jgi:alpha-N-arabinofuranosidase
MSQLRFIRIVAVSCLLAAGVVAEEVRVRVTDTALHPVDRRLFGQFLERASWGEPGPEAFVDPATGQLPTNIVAMLKEMRLPVVRFPGGSDVDRIDWTDMIDNVPGRTGPRPVSQVTTNQIANRFGYDEFFALRDELGCETIVVLNVVDALTKRRPLSAAVAHAAGLVAYCNAPVGAKLPAGMADWAAVRARNGRAQPFRAEFFQLGNEWFMFHQQVSDATGLKDKALADWYVAVLHEFIKTIRAIAPDAILILDGNMGGGIEQMVLRDTLIREAARYATFHVYAPGPVGPVRRGTEPVAPGSLDLADWWYATASIPGTLVNGLNFGLGDQPRLARSLGYRIACTEWNWNGWGFQDARAPFETEHLPNAKEIGVAGFLHGLMRQGDTVEVATQSMLLGSHWSIATVRADPTGRNPPHYTPQGSAAALYTRHHGDRLLAIEHAPLAAHVQPFIVGRWTRWPETMPGTVAYLDLLVSADAQRVYVHAINRHFTDAQPLQVDLTALDINDTTAQHHRPSAVATSIEIKAGTLAVTLPARSVNIIEISRP